MARLKFQSFGRQESGDCHPSAAEADVGTRCRRQSVQICGQDTGISAAAPTTAPSQGAAGTIRSSEVLDGIAVLGSCRIGEWPSVGVQLTASCPAFGPGPLLGVPRLPIAIQVSNIIKFLEYFERSYTAVYILLSVLSKIKRVIE